eukprot:1156717-Pelagomonas_calceolata.AAC.1
MGDPPCTQFHNPAPHKAMSRHYTGKLLYVCLSASKCIPSHTTAPTPIAEGLRDWGCNIFRRCKHVMDWKQLISNLLSDF